MSLPDFLLAGAMKAGTTSIYHYLRQHPDVFMPDKKEPHFLAFAAGWDFRFVGPGDQRVFTRMLVKDRGRYEGLFRDAGTKVVKGEASAMYLCLPGTAQAIKALVPSARVIFVLRDPVERAFSAFTHMIRDGREPERDFMRALDLEEERVSAGWSPIWWYRRAGCYAQQLSEYTAQFDAAHLKIVLFDDLVNDPLQVMADLFHFLGVDSEFQPSTGDQHNPSGIPRSGAARSAYLALRHDSKLRRLGKQVLPAKLGRWMRLTAMRVLVERGHSKGVIPQEARDRLSATFAEPNRELATVIGRDLSAWT
jgi:hypothetical protein